MCCVYSKGVESPTKKVVGIVERLRHECSFHPFKAHVVAYALSHMTMGSVSHTEEAKKDLVKDVHRLVRLGVRLKDSVNGC